jgi:hypothetical protein
LVDEFHFSAVFKCFDPLFVWRGPILFKQHQCTPRESILFGAGKSGLGMNRNSRSGPPFSPNGWDSALKVFWMAVLVGMAMKQTFLLPGPVSVHRVMGGIAAYLLIGVTRAFGYKLLLEIIPNAIHFQTPPAAGVATGEPGRLIYFSFETLTTVSYGDAYSVHRIARSLTTAEALIGQLYPAILIATLVGMALQARIYAALKETEDKRPS